MSTPSSMASDRTRATGSGAGVLDRMAIFLRSFLLVAGAFLRSLFDYTGHRATNTYIVERIRRTLSTVEQDSKGTNYRLLLHAGIASPTSIQAEYWPRKCESQSDFWHTTYHNHLTEGNESCLCRRCEYVRTQLRISLRQLRIALRLRQETQ